MYQATLSVNGETVAKGRIEKTQPLIFSADETVDVGLDNQTPVAEGIGIGRDETEALKLFKPSKGALLRGLFQSGKGACDLVQRVQGEIFESTKNVFFHPLCRQL